MNMTTCVVGSGQTFFYFRKISGILMGSYVISSLAYFVMLSRRTLQLLIFWTLKICALYLLYIYLSMPSKELNQVQTYLNGLDCDPLTNDSLVFPWEIQALLRKNTTILFMSKHPKIILCRVYGNLIAFLKWYFLSEFSSRTVKILMIW
jgi:hypothetical protein